MVAIQAPHAHSAVMELEIRVNEECLLPLVIDGKILFGPVTGAAGSNGLGRRFERDRELLARYNLRLQATTQLARDFGISGLIGRLSHTRHARQAHPHKTQGQDRESDSSDSDDCFHEFALVVVQREARPAYRVPDRIIPLYLASLPPYLFW